MCLTVRSCVAIWLKSLIASTDISISMASSSSTFDKSNSDILPVPSLEQSSFHSSCRIDWTRFVEPWTVDSAVGPVQIANLPPNAAQCSIFLLPWEVYIHRGHALEHRFFRWEKAGLCEQIPWDRGDTQDSLAIKVRVPNRSEMKQLNVHDLVGYSYKVPTALAGNEWTHGYLIHHGGAGLHYDSRVQHLHMES